MSDREGIFQRLISMLGRARLPADNMKAEPTQSLQMTDQPEAVYPKRVWADFNGLFRGGEMLCLSHKDTSTDEEGNIVKLRRGMRLTAFMEDIDDDEERDDLVASGTVEPSPDWLQCRGSKWVLMVDENGVRHESEIE